MARVREHFGGFAAGGPLIRRRMREPEQMGERRLVIRKEGTTAYFRAGFHAPAVADPTFVPALLLDAVLTGAKGANLWTALQVPPPQRVARLYQGGGERGLASQGITEEELARVKRQLHAQVVFDADSVTNVAHQPGFFEHLAVGSRPVAATGTVEAQR